MLQRAVEETRDRFHAGPFLLGLAAFALSNVFGSMQWNLLLRAQGIHIPFRRALSLYFVGLFFSNFLPANLGGDVVKVVDLHRDTGKGSGAVAATLMDRGAGLAILALMATVAGLISREAFGAEPFLLLLPGFLLFFLAGGAAIMSNRVVKLLQKTMAIIPFQAVRNAADSVLTALFQFRSRKRALLLAVLMAIPVQTLRVLVHLFAARSIGIDAAAAPAVYFFLFIPIVAVFIALPISINGLGVREGLGVYFYGLIGIGDELAFSISFLAYLIGVVVSLIGGLVFVFRPTRRRMADLPPEAESS